ncbi:MAG: alpha/beta hydrolase [Dokdonella sp.]
MQDKFIGAGPIVCVHGAGAGGWEWGIWARMFNVHGFDVMAPDLMPVTAGLAATQFADYRAQVVAWCAASPGKSILAGASLGGLLALSAAAEVEPMALVLVNPVPPRGIAGMRTRTWLPVVTWSRDRSLTGTRGAMPDSDDGARMYAYRRWRDESGAVLDAAQTGIDCSVPGCPILVLTSADDKDVPPATSRALATWLGADFELVQQASHVGPLLGRDAPSAAERVCGWLQRRVPARI